VAYPVDAGQATTSVGTSATPWTVNLPGSIVAGDLLVLFSRQATLVLHGSNSGWVTKVDNASDASDDVTSFAFKIATGTEGATMSWNQGSACKGAAIVWRVTGAYPYDPLFVSRLPDWAAVNVGVGANPDPGNVVVTGTGGAQDCLFIEIAGLDGETQTFTASTNYTNIQNANSGTAGVATTNVCIGGATRQLTAASEDPGAMTAAAPSTGWCAFTIAIHPAPPSVPPNFDPVPFMRR